MARLQLEALHKRYDDTPVLTDLSLDIADGEFVALVGPSGCGKSTLLRTIAGLERVDAGQIRFDGRPVTEEPPQRRGVAMVFQGYALYPHMSVRGNLAFGLEQQRLGRDEIERRIARAASALQLDALLDRRPSQLSGGQRQRVAMGRAMVREPLAFLFDEPLSNLDAQLRVQLRTEIRLLQQRLGTTTVYVTHDQEEAMTMADRIVVLRDGRIEQIGDPLTLYDRPANLFVARFIGSPPMNLLEVLAAPEGLLVGPGGLWWAAAGAAHAPGTRLQLGVRPEHLRLVTEDGSRAATGDAGAGRVQLEVQRVDSLGAQTELHGPVIGAPADQRWLARLPGRPDVQPGQVVTLDWRPEHAHLFDASSGERVTAGAAP